MLKSLVKALDQRLERRRLPADAKEAIRQRAEVMKLEKSSSVQIDFK